MTPWPKISFIWIYLSNYMKFLPQKGKQSHIQETTHKKITYVSFLSTFFHGGFWGGICGHGIESGSDGSITLSSLGLSVCLVSQNLLYSGLKKAH